ncbi:hypothetical protein [Acerihabitans arboris]|uniref:Lipoprotein n=1 Tax=Acerihabitans arboris TaxID=2691583 RepID=A0A845SFL9_9GAMM|nr:hypothetical protein [Acerihabitans arboris]NDL61498.1 hypothetical protein [Acerihabitans arboris]
MKKLFLLGLLACMPSLSGCLSIGGHGYHDRPRHDYPHQRDVDRHHDGGRDHRWR